MSGERLCCVGSVHRSHLRQSDSRSTGTTCLPDYSQLMVNTTALYITCERTHAGIWPESQIYPEPFANSERFGLELKKARLYEVNVGGFIKKGRTSVLALEG
ncbi:hypothetical protein Baya_3062 [Bagarius yarrelli]|uniref:Uncharacterized protein n=1 Tax=Bagarius yarrelli TaxID=175774 RepID=A0A556TUB9_BAGYA|nr:hypothetical protein Baya_3062 [Bagarius yarrelli]